MSTFETTHCPYSKLHPSIPKNGRQRLDASDVTPSEVAQKSPDPPQQLLSTGVSKKWTVAQQWLEDAHEKLKEERQKELDRLLDKKLDVLLDDFRFQ